MIPVAAGPVRGPRHARLLDQKLRMSPVRAFPSPARHRLDVRATGTNNDGSDACAIVVNIYARTRLQVELAPERELVDRADGFTVSVAATALAGGVVDTSLFGRLVGPAIDVADTVRGIDEKDIPRRATYRAPGDKRSRRRIDTAILLGLLDRERFELAEMIDEEVLVAEHDDGPPHFHVEERRAPGGWHLGVYLEGSYCPEHDSVVGQHDHDHTGADHDHDHGDPGGEAGHHDDCALETFTRFLSASIATVEAPG
jgi:hypothetical protein